MAKAAVEGGSPRRAGGRMTGPQRRRHILEVASQIFAREGYRGATTAAIAKAAGISEPVLYHHFGGKRGLYIACVHEQWERLRTAWDAAIAAQTDPRRYLQSMVGAGAPGGEVVVSLWTQAIADASGDPQISEALSDNVREIHAYVSAVYAREQAEGGCRADCDPDAEAWIFIAIGVLRAADGSLGASVAESFPGILLSRHRWLRGE